MFQIELFQTLQFVLALAVILLISYSIVRAFRFQGFTAVHVISDSGEGQFFDYTKILTVADYENYHKYQIWRFYLFSK